MPQSFFIWNGVDCRSKGIILRGPVPIVRPEERVRHKEIPGVPGDLTELEGEDVYNSYIQTASITVSGAFNVREVNRWLRGAGYVTFSGEPDRRQKARVIGAVTLNKVSRNLDKWTGECQFYCQPFKELLYPESVTVSSSGGTVRNNGDVKSHPRITANGAAAGSVIVITSGGKTFTVDMTDMEDTGCVIDCETQMVMNYSGTANLTMLSSGDFPILDIGENTFTGSGWSSLVFDKKERYL